MKTKIISSMACNALLAAVTVSLLASCTSTSRMRSTKATGFLGDYSQLHKGSSSEAQLLYIRPNVRWAGYDKIIIDPITAYAIPGNPLAELPKDQLNALVGYLHASLGEHLGKSYKIVTKPGPGAMRLRVALTEADANAPVRGVISSVMPIGVAISALKTVATGSGTATGHARVEMELLDASTGERLSAAVDAQSGNKRDFFGNFNRWDDAQDAFDNWSDRLAMRLAELRAGGK